MSVIYDIGMHNGDDTDYYLTKGAQVIAVEADPSLCALAEQRFAAFLGSGQLTIINAAVSDEVGRATFYRHKEVSEWNTLVAPKQPDSWEELEVETAPLHSLIRRDAEIEFLKIDIEGYDFRALDSLDRARLIPPHLSCEAHSVDIPCKLVAMGYTRFRLVNCKLQRKRLRRAVIKTLDGKQVRYSFSRASSGPYGEDLQAPWLDRDQLIYTWSGRATLLGNGWYDIHAMRA